VIPLHFGELHAYEQVLVLVIALGPFIVLGIAVHVVRKRDLAAERSQEDPDGQS
jgi:hypothetical protein